MSRFSPRAVRYPAAAALISVPVPATEQSPEYVRNIRQTPIATAAAAAAHITANGAFAPPGTANDFVIQVGSEIAPYLPVSLPMRAVPCPVRHTPRSLCFVRLFSSHSLCAIGHWPPSLYLRCRLFCTNLISCLSISLLHIILLQTQNFSLFSPRHTVSAE